jgi:nucleotide-binding universal stress UspA family protein
MGIKNILVGLTGGDCDGSALTAAYLVAKPFAADLDVLRVEPEPIQIIVRAALEQFASKRGNTELIHALQHEEESRTLSARAAFDEFVAEFQQGRDAPYGAGASWRQVIGDPVQTLIVEGRYSDLIVLGRGTRPDELPADAVANILVGCGRPLLLAPNAVLPSLGKTIAIAWKEAAEAARAVTAAMPLLQRSDRIVVLTADESGADPVANIRSAQHLAKSLARHGFNPEAKRVTVERESPSRALVRSAVAEGADLLVMGAYSHGRTRELVFGGFTRELLKSCDLPLLLLH